MPSKTAPFAPSYAQTAYSALVSVVQAPHPPMTGGISPKMVFVRLVAFTRILDVVSIRGANDCLGSFGLAPVLPVVNLTVGVAPCPVYLG